MAEVPGESRAVGNPLMWGPLTYRGEPMTHPAFMHEHNKACADFGCEPAPTCGHPAWFNGVVWFHMDPADDDRCDGFYMPPPHLGAAPHVEPAPMLLDCEQEWHEHGEDCDEAGCEPVYIPKNPERRRAWFDQHGLTDEERDAIEQYVRHCEYLAAGYPHDQWYGQLGPLEATNG